MMFSTLPATRSVSVKPGHTALTVMARVRQFQRERADEADDCVLGGAVGADIGVTLEAGGRCDRNDAAMTAASASTATPPEIACTTPMKLTSIMRLNSAASDFAKGADSAMPGIGDQDIDRLPRSRLRNRRADRSLIRHIGDVDKMRVARRNGFIQRRAVTAEHRDGCARSRPIARRWPGRCRGRRRSPAHAGNAAVRTCACSLGAKQVSAYILYFKLLQGSGRPVSIGP